MKKTYKTPEILVVQIRTKSVILQLSVNPDEISGENAGWTKEYDNSTISGKNVWEDEW